MNCDQWYRVVNMGPGLSNPNPLFPALLLRRSGNDDARIAERENPQHRRFRTTEGQLGNEQEPPLGSHVVTPRPGYLHHGIYVGGGKIVHYAGFARGLQRGPVEEISFAAFTRGRPAWIRSTARPSFDYREVIRRARSRIGEDRYRIWTNNCEHFCEWCLRGEHRSYQVEAWVTRARRALRAAIRYVARP